MELRALLALRALLLLATVGTEIGTARADDTEGTTATGNRAIIDQVQLEPSVLTGHRLRLTISALSLQGQRLDLTEPKSIKAFAGPSEIKAPYVLGT